MYRESEPFVRQSDQSAGVRGLTRDPSDLAAALAIETGLDRSPAGNNRMPPWFMTFPQVTKTGPGFNRGSGAAPRGVGVTSKNGHMRVQRGVVSYQPTLPVVCVWSLNRPLVLPLKNN